MKSVCVCGDYKPRITHGCYNGDRVEVCKNCGRHSPDCYDDSHYENMKQKIKSLVVAESEEHTGLSVDYYRVDIDHPTSGGDPYTAECNDIIEALNMTYAEGNVVKAIWRRAAERTLGKRKKGNNSKYDAEKAFFFSGRILEQENTD